MERKIRYFIILLLLLGFSARGQYRDIIYQAYIGDDMTPWKEAIDEMESSSNKEDAFRMELLNYEYGYIGYCLGIDNYSQAKKYIGKAEIHMDILEEKGYDLSSLYAYRSAFVGFQIGLKPYKAPFLGPNSVKMAEKAVTINPQNYLGHLQLANILYWTPPLFGGSKTEAVEKYILTLNYYRNSNPHQTGDWNYLSLYIAIINACIETERYQEAEKYCLEALEAEPDFSWIKNDLYPQILNNQKDE